MSSKVFETELGRKIYKEAAAAISDFSMKDMLSSGVLLGFSGGADSVMLLHFLIEYRKNNFDFPIVCVHVNHGIRDGAADSDEAFSRRVANELGVEFLSVKRDIPAIAKSIGAGLEETAR